jgi:hypothetical protein
MTFTTPGGKTVSRILTNSSKLKEVMDEGFMTTVSPAASAGAIFHAAIRKGKFQGIICPTTPIGSRSMMLIVFLSIITA